MPRGRNRAGDLPDLRDEVRLALTEAAAPGMTRTAPWSNSIRSLIVSASGAIGAKFTRHTGTPVSALRAVPIVTKPRHQRRPRPRDALRSPAASVGLPLNP
jgi:hypothetical protein